MENQQYCTWSYAIPKLYQRSYFEFEKQYTVPVYDLDNIDVMSDENGYLTINDQPFLESLLMKIRGKSISYAAYMKKKQMKEGKEFIEDIDVLEGFF